MDRPVIKIWVEEFNKESKELSLWLRIRGQEYCYFTNVFPCVGDTIGIFDGEHFNSRDVIELPKEIVE